MRSSERLQLLEDAVLHLRERAEGATVVVEGRRDVEALEWLGIGGRHVTLQRGRPLAAICEELARVSGLVILLTDWDRTGGRLVKALQDQLHARVTLDTECRRRIALAARVRCIEEIPWDLQALRENT